MIRSDSAPIWHQSRSSIKKSRTNIWLWSVYFYCVVESFDCQLTWWVVLELWLKKGSKRTASSSKSAIWRRLWFYIFDVFLLKVNISWGVDRTCCVWSGRCCAASPVWPDWPDSCCSARLHRCCSSRRTTAAWTDGTRLVLPPLVETEETGPHFKLVFIIHGRDHFCLLCFKSSL